MGGKKKGREEERNGSVGKENLDDETGMRMSIVPERACLSLEILKARSAGTVDN